MSAGLLIQIMRCRFEFPPLLPVYAAYPPANSSRFWSSKLCVTASSWLLLLAKLLLRACMVPYLKAPPRLASEFFFTREEDHPPTVFGLCVTREREIEIESKSESERETGKERVGR